MINVWNSVGQSSLNNTIYTIDSTVTENFIITEYAGNKVAQKQNSHQRVMEWQ
jgi:hypothetical protein